ncbi:DUF465 domain-containing protein [Novosphingobium sp. Leaf2]|uniref:DUF465 domain-containing protein n=1 Tax=Novosphingobium sp. Leaf2 TaxID=1735670 RepID=UPI0009EB1298|nr:DUF465 domain-containing protein [Novosphingobium sp. Leaf2]
MTNRMFRLLELHQKLDALIARAAASRGADPLALALLRKRKLRLRERLSRLFAARVMGA